MRLLAAPLLAAALLMLAGCAGRHGETAAAPAGAGAAAGARAAEPAAVAKVVRDGKSWTVEYRFAQASPIWAFTRSALPLDSQRSWRADTWTVETPGVRLERLGWYDVLTTDSGAVPRVVRIRFEPFRGQMANSYDPALIFTDGSVALFDSQFHLFPVTRARAKDLPLDANEVPEADARTRIGFRDAGGRVLFGGRRHRSLVLDDLGSYVLFGPAEPVVTKDAAAIIDPALPAWLRGFLTRWTPDILGRYAQTLGPGPKATPTLIVSWKGPTPRLISMGGSVLKDLVTMTFEGEGVVQERAELANDARWFIAHEGAHFWLGQTVRYEFGREAWITEGGAELLAIRTVQAIDPAFDWKARVNSLIAECATLTQNRGVATAAERREHRAFYSCGALAGLLVERRTGQPFSSFVRSLIEANRADGIASRADWLAMARERTGDAELVRWIETMVDQGFADPAAAIASEMERLAIPFERPEGKAPRLL